MAARDFRDLTVWQRSVDLIVEVYKLTRGFPADERFGMTMQIRRAAMSIASNIAEGNGRSTVRAYANFLATSRGSLNETHSLLIVSNRLEFSSPSSTSRVFELTDEVGRMLYVLRASLLKSAHRRSS